jgi:hypothetical protein
MEIFFGNRRSTAPKKQVHGGKYPRPLTVEPDDGGMIFSAKTNQLGRGDEIVVVLSQIEVEQIVAAWRDNFAGKG